MSERVTGRNVGALASSDVALAAADQPPVIDPLPEDGILRPFWSVMIPVFNCQAGYLRETLQSVLAQDPGKAEMQIEVVDNRSTDGDVEALVHEIGAGRIDFHRQPRNVGMAGNFNSCIRRARGHWVHILHGDDTVRPGFYARARQGVERYSEAGAAFCRQTFIDRDSREMYQSEIEAEMPGVLGDDFVSRLQLNSRIQFPSIVVRRSIYEEVGGFRPTLQVYLDWDMWKRVALRTPIFYSPESLACFRLHDGADSSRLVQMAEDVVEARRSIDISCAVDVPPEQASSIRRMARQAAAVRAIRLARQMWDAGNREAAWRQASEAARCSYALPVLLRLGRFLAEAAMRPPTRRKINQALERTP